MEIVPALGFGLRFLNDLGGNYVSFYDRHSKYLYLPIKLNIVYPFSDGPNASKLSANLEYDHLINGTQKSDLSDANLLEFSRVNDA